MSLKTITTVSILALAVAAGPPVRAAASSDEAELTRLESVWNNAHLTGDADALDRLWADDLSVTAPRMPVMSKIDALTFARSGRMKFDRYETSETNIRVYGDTAVVIGRLKRTRTMDGKSVSDDWRFTKVYVRRGGAWRVVAFHASESAP